MSDENTYPQGTPVWVDVEFRDKDRVLADPTNPTIVVKVPPTGVETAYVYPAAAEVVKASTGKYGMWIQTAAAAGRYGYRGKGTGATDPRREKFFYVEQSEFTAV